MKVLHVLDHSLPDVDGYSVRSAHVLHIQRDDGLTPIVLTSPRQAVASQAVESIEAVPHYRTLGPRRSLLDARTLYRRLEEVVRHERPCLIHAHSPSLWAVAAWAVARRQRLPFVYEMRSLWEDAAVDNGTTQPESLRYRLTRALETWVLRRAGAVTTICQGLAQAIAERGVPATKVFVAPNGVDAARFAPRPADPELAARLRLPSAAPTIGFLGSMIALEGVESLIEALPSILHRVPDAHLVLVGDGPRLDALRAMQQRVAQPQRVRIVGAVPPSEVPRYYSLLDVVVFPRQATRLTEMVTPLKPLEAMAMGKAVLIANVGGLRELVDDSVGLRFRPGDVEHLTQQCVALLGDPVRRATLGHAARRRVLETRSWKLLAPLYRKAYSVAGADPGDV